MIMLIMMMLMRLLMMLLLMRMRRVRGHGLMLFARAKNEIWEQAEDWSCLIKFQFIYKTVWQTHTPTHTVENGLERVCVLLLFFRFHSHFSVSLSLGLVAAITYSNRLPHMCRTAKCPLFCIRALSSKHMLPIKLGLWAWLGACHAAVDKDAADCSR